MAVQFLQTVGDGTNQTNYTFTSQNIGTATPTRHIICTVVGRSSDGTSRSIVGVSIGGVSATEAIQSENGTSGNVAGIYCAELTTGTTANVLVVFSGTMTSADIALYSSNNLVSTTATNAGTSTVSPGTFDIDVVAGGFVVAISKSINPNATATWVGVSEDFDEQDGNGDDKSGGSASFTTTQTNTTVSCTWTASATPIFAAASYEIDADVSLTMDTLSLTSSAIDVSSVTGGAIASPAVVEITASAITPTASIPTPDWLNTDKNSSSWVNQDKS